MLRREPKCSLSLRQNFSWNFAGNLVYATCQWGILVVLAKLTNPESVGQFAFGLAVTAPIILFSQLQLRGIQATDAHDEYEFGHYLGLRLITTTLALLLIALIVGVNRYDINTAVTIMAIGLSKAFESIADVYYGLMQRHERMDRIAYSRMIKGPLSLVVLGVMVFVTRSVFWGAIGLALAWGFVLIAYDLRNAQITLKECCTARCEPLLSSGSISPSFSTRRLLHLAWLAMPLGLVMALISLNSNIPRYFIEHHFGAAKLGIFAALAYLIVAGNTLISAMGQACVPRLAKHYAAGQLNLYLKLLLYLIGIGALIGVCGIVVALIAGPLLLTMLYRPEYAEHATVFTALMIAGAISYVASCLGYAMTAARYFKAQLPLFAVVTLATGATSWVLIPRFGLVGAVTSLIIGATVQIAGSIGVIVHATNAIKPTAQR